MAHTPGEWEWDAIEQGDVLLLAGPGGIFENPVLDVSKCKSCRGTKSQCTLPSEDDQALIAAAPETLEACMAVYDSVDPEVPSTIPGPAFAKVMKALVKAKMITLNDEGDLFLKTELGDEAEAKARGK